MSRVAPIRWALVALLATLVLVPSAAAASPEDFSAADQYVEMLPTVGGPSATKDRERNRTRLPSKVADKLEAQGGEDAAKLEEVATSNQFGAPQAESDSADKNKREPSSTRETTAVPTASVKAVRDSGEDMLWLLFALIAITGLMVGAVAYQRHKNSKSG